jgi:hypothetical protein
MWRYGHLPWMRQVARRLLPVLENELRLTVYPDQATCWHYDDKIAQSYLFEAAAIPTPETWVWFEKQSALAWAKRASYPIVLKLWAGAGSTNVRLIRNGIEAMSWIDRLFDRGVTSLELPTISARDRLSKAARMAVRGDYPSLPWETHRGYALFQEFLPDNAYDTRITVIGNRAFGYRRYNRQGDFRASGSGRCDHDPKGIAPDFIELAFATAKGLRMQSCAVDCLWRSSEPVVTEVSYTYRSDFVHDCPGHWDSDLAWHEGQMWPEEAQVRDFLVRLEETWNEKSAKGRE